MDGKSQTEGGQDLKTATALTGGLAILQVADETNASATGQSQIRLLQSQLLAPLFDDPAQVEGGGDGFVLHSRAGIMDFSGS